MSDGVFGVLVGLFIGMLIWIAAAIGGGFDEHPYRDCAEDEVWAWQQDYRPVYGESPWECVAIDDLMGGR